MHFIDSFKLIKINENYIYEDLYFIIIYFIISSRRRQKGVSVPNFHMAHALMPWKLQY